MKPHSAYSNRVRAILNAGGTKMRETTASIASGSACISATNAAIAQAA